MKKWRHDELLDDLANHLRRPERMMWCDMQLGSSGSARPDIYTLNKSYSNPKPLVYEIKISVADYRSDVTSGKWQKYLEFASGVYFATPAGLISKQDLPPGCGLIVRGETGWSALKAPTLHHLSALPQEAMLKLLIDGIERASKSYRRNHFNDREVLDRLKKQFGEDVATALRDLAKVRAEHANLQASVDFEIDSAKRHAESIIQRAKQTQQVELDRINSVAKDLRNILGLEPDASGWDMRHALNELKDKICADTRIKRCEQIISNLERDIARAREMFPQKEMADAQS